MMQLYPYLRNLLALIARNEEGQDLIEYALIVVVIVLVGAAALFGIGDEIAEIYSKINSMLVSFNAAT